VTFCRTITCTHGTHISLNTRVFLVFLVFFLTLRFLTLKYAYLCMGKQSDFTLPLLSVFCPPNESVNRYMDCH
jgi:hypothetical protein